MSKKTSVPKKTEDKISNKTSNKVTNKTTKKFGGMVLFLNRDNINTDEIIPAKYLTLIEKLPLKPHLLEDLKLEGFTPSQIKFDDYSAVVSRSNFGCGSSREMAPWAFEVNGINTIIASNFARIFRENAFNCGMLAIELDSKIINDIFTKFQSKETAIKVDIDKKELEFQSGTEKMNVKFKLNAFEEDLVRAGGWVELASQKY